MYWTQFFILIGTIGGMSSWVITTLWTIHDQRALKNDEIVAQITVMRRESTDFHAKICEISMRGKK